MKIKLTVTQNELISAILEAHPEVTSQQAREYIFKNLVLPKAGWVNLELDFEKGIKKEP